VFIAVVGCENIKPPSRDARVTRRGDVTTVVCADQSGETWQVTCRDNTWLGEIGNCSSASSVAGAGKSYLVFTVRRYALHGICDSNSVRPSVCPSVCLSVTLLDCVHMVRPTIMISSPYGSPIILVSGDITFIPKFEGGHPKRGR